MHLISVIVSHLASFLVITRTLSVACCFFYVFHIFWKDLFCVLHPPLFLTLSSFLFSSFSFFGSRFVESLAWTPNPLLGMKGVQHFRLRSHDNQKKKKTLNKKRKWTGTEKDEKVLFKRIYFFVLFVSRSLSLHTVHLKNVVCLLCFSSPNISMVKSLWSLIFFLP